jgi:hypothetical protein
VAAELTVAAYPVALRQGLAGSWVDLEIDMWMALVKSLRNWGWPPPAADRGDHALRREDLVAHLTDAAYRTTLRHGPHGSFLDLELGLQHAFREAIDGIASQPDDPELVVESYHGASLHAAS